MFVCPFCGEMISDKAKVCPHCGSDERTGWQQTFDADDGYDFEPDIEEDESDGLLNPKKHPLTTIGFVFLVLTIVALFLYRYIL